MDAAGVSGDPLEDVVDTGTLKTGVPTSTVDEGEEYDFLSEVSEGTEPGRYQRLKLARGSVVCGRELMDQFEALGRGRDLRNRGRNNI
ncbi:hypothetical protein KJ359_007637 [Pestalotiopsis sp. 9143b]|nr:hypothetical protein KJ359_007637 [Pestalotiopsis sp. 9143b]